jgi:transmembrane sensor
LVKEGVVELDRTTNRKELPARVSANTRVLASSDVPFVAASVPKAKIDRETAWQFGRVALDNQTLAAASEEFARYSDIRVVVDPSVANRTVTGLFVANDPVAFAKAAAGVLDLQVDVSEGQVKLLEKPGAAKVGKS